jgi:hypothetical protein
VLDKPVASEATLREMELDVRDIVAGAVNEARTILTRRRSDLGHGAELLLKKEAITVEDFPPPAVQTSRGSPRRTRCFNLSLRGRKGFSGLTLKRYSV